MAASEFSSFRHPDLKDPCRGFHLWDTATGKLKIDLSQDLKETMAAVSYAADGKWFAVGNGEEKPVAKVMLLDPATGKKIREMTSPIYVGALGDTRGIGHLRATD